MKEIVLLIHDIRSCHNVGALLRTADGLGISKVFISGYTPYPSLEDDDRLPHIHQKLTKQIHKTALGAEVSVDWRHVNDVHSLIDSLKQDGFTIAALEQSDTSVELRTYTPPDKIALLLGREVEGISDELLLLSDITLEIPMLGKKESLNVVQAAAIALYSLSIG